MLINVSVLSAKPRSAPPPPSLVSEASVAGVPTDPFPDDRVIAVAAAEVVGALATFDDVISRAAGDGVIAIAAGQLDRRGDANGADDVVAFAADDSFHIRHDVGV